MIQHQFESMGTLWTILIDEQSVDSEFWTRIENKTHQFDQQYSRFINSSEVMQLAAKPPGTYPISEDLTIMLQFASTLKKETDGQFDPAVGELLEQAGYDPTYSFTPTDQTSDWQAVDWSIEDKTVIFNKRCVFDIGGFGKGYWIDKLCEIVEKAGYHHYLVDGGGDMRGSQKKDGNSWNIAIEIPGKPEQAISIIPLKNQALAVSDTYKRRWQKNWHHVIDPKEKKSTTKSVGCSVIADTATIADAMTTCLMLSDEKIRKKLCKKYQAEYLLFLTQENIVKSQQWPGEMFS